MSEGELITRLCQLRDELKRTPWGFAALYDVRFAMEIMVRHEKQGEPISYEAAKKATKTVRGE